MTWVIVNSLASVIVFVSICYLLGAHGHRFNLLERLGFGLTGAGAILTIGAVMSRQDIVLHSPYDDWSGTLLRLGIMLSMFGVIGRLEGYAPASRLAPMPGEGKVK